MINSQKQGVNLVRTLGSIYSGIEGVNYDRRSGVSLLGISKVGHYFDKVQD